MMILNIILKRISAEIFILSLTFRDHLFCILFQVLLMLAFSILFIIRYLKDNSLFQSRGGSLKVFS